MSVLRSQLSKTRPANTTQYAIGDVINESTSAGTVWEFTGMASKEGGAGVINTALLIDSVKASTALAANLFLFSVAPGTDDDNDAATITDAEMQDCVGVIQFASASMVEATPSNGNGMTQVTPDIYYKCASGDSSLYGVLIAANTYTPTSAEVFDIVLQGTALN